MIPALPPVLVTIVGTSVIWMVLLILGGYFLTGLIPGTTNITSGSDRYYQWPRHGFPLAFRWIRYTKPEIRGRFRIMFGYVGEWGYEDRGVAVTWAHRQLWISLLRLRGYVISETSPEIRNHIVILSQRPLYGGWNLYTLGTNPNPTPEVVTADFE